MEIASVKGETRTTRGRKANHRLRQRGLLPAVIYGHGEAPETVALSEHDLIDCLHHGHHVVNLTIDGDETKYLLKDVQYDYLQKNPIHVDLVRVKLDERVRVRVGVELRGVARGTNEGGVLLQMQNDIEVECPVLDIPDTLRVRIDELAVNDQLCVQDVPLPAGVIATSEPDEIIALVQPKRTADAETEEIEEEAAEDAGSEPEVIGRAAKDEAEAEE